MRGVFFLKKKGVGLIFLGNIGLRTFRAQLAAERAGDDDPFAATLVALPSSSLPTRASLQKGRTEYGNLAQQPQESKKGAKKAKAGRKRARPEPEDSSEEDEEDVRARKQTIAAKYASIAPKSKGLPPIFKIRRKEVKK